MNSPWCGTLTLTTQNTAYNLLTLLQAKDPDIVAQRIVRCQFLLIQMDSSLGSGTVYIGNANVSTTEYGSFLVALQSESIPSVDANLIILSSIYLFSDTASVTFHITFVTR